MVVNIWIHKQHMIIATMTTLSHGVPYSPILNGLFLLAMSSLVGELLHQTVDQRVCLGSQPHPERVATALKGETY